MNRMKRSVLLTKLLERMRDAGSWGGETHLQKATFFLQELMKVPLGFDFILYKHGPFSFDLGDEIGALRGYRLLEFELHRQYSPHLRPTERCAYFWDRFPNTLKKYDGRIRFVAEELGDRGVVQLELLGTALYVTLRADVSRQLRAHRMTSLKPHVSLPVARTAIAQVDRVIAGSKAILDASSPAGA